MQRAVFWAAYLVGVSLLFIMTISIMLFARYTASADRIEIISVYSQPEQAAIQTLQNRGLQVAVERNVNVEIPVGLVYDQRPLPGTKLDKGEQITIFISEGGDLLPVPEVVGQDVRDAERLLQSVDFGYQTQVSREENVAIEGIVIRQIPEKGERLAPGGVVQLVVSSGVERIPDVTNSLLGNARRVLENLNYRVRVSEVPHGRVPAEVVITTNPEPDAPTPESREITLVVSTGAQVFTELPLPDLRGETEILARLELEALGFTVTIAYQDPELEDRRGVVIGQFPGPGVIVPAGATVRLFVTRFIAGVDPR